ncbi:MAG: SIS domain-containing protein [Erysipelotrichaceae bacterium]
MGYNSYKEISESYIQIKETINTMKNYKDEIINFFDNNSDIVLLGCGSSYWSILSAGQSLRSHTKRKVYTFKATEISLSKKEYLNCFTNPVFVIPSRSGESKELIDSLIYFKEVYPTAKIFSITEFVNNTLTGMSNLNISIPFAEEISVCQTRSFNCLYTSLICVVSFLSDENIINDLNDYLSNAKNYYNDAESKVITLVEKFNDSEIVALGSGIQYGAVIEGAYIIMEMAQYVTNYFQVLEYRHGPVVTANEKTIVFITSTRKENLKIECKMASEIKKAGSKIVFIGTEQEVDEGILSFTIKPYCEEVRALYSVMILQHFAYYLAIKLGKNPDKPGDLVKYITY